MSSNQIQYVKKNDSSLSKEKRSVVVDRELDRIYKRDGTVNASTLLDSARDRTSPIHGFFEWDDKVSGEKWRLTQATEMILASKFVVILKQGESRLPQVVSAEPVRRFLPQCGGGGFKMRNEALGSVDNREQIITRKKKQLVSWCESVVDIDEFNQLRSLIEAELKNLD